MPTRIPAVKLKDGTIVTKEVTTHLDVVESTNTDVERVESTGWIVDGQYTEKLSKAEEDLATELTNRIKQLASRGVRSIQPKMAQAIRSGKESLEAAKDIEDVHPEVSAQLHGIFAKLIRTTKSIPVESFGKALNLPVGTTIDPGASGTSKAGKMKVQLPTGGTSWRSMRAGMAMDALGNPVSVKGKV